MIGPQDNGPSEVTTATIYINPGDGDFSNAEKILLPRGIADNLAQVTLDVDDIDLNGDGYRDLIINITEDYRTQHVQILINNGGLGFTDETAVRFPQTPSSIENWTYLLDTKDFNGDGHLDLLFRNSVDTHIALNDGRGNFHSFAENDLFYNGNGTPHFLRHTYGDLNGDGLNDVLVYAGIYQGAERLFRYLQEEQGVTQIGTSGRDSMMGSSANETFEGRDGDDTIFSGAGNDIILGESGTDTVIAGAGNDVVFGGNQNDYLDGGDGDDQILGELGADTLYGGDGNDLILGGNRNDRLFGENGDDRTFGGNGNDLVDAGAGSDILRGGSQDDILTGGTGDDVAFGGTGRDSLSGDDGNDLLFGRGGFDILNGGAGDDTLEGGIQADQFIFEGAFGNDTITDFAATNNAERINLSAVNAISDFQDLIDNHMSQVGADVVIDDLNGNTITLLGVTLSDLDAIDFVF